MYLVLFAMMAVTSAFYVPKVYPKTNLLDPRSPMEDLSLVDYLLNGCPVNPEHSLLLSHQTNCSSYYECTNGRKVLNHCPPGLLFDYISQDCLQPEETECIIQDEIHEEDLTTSIILDVTTTDTSKTWTPFVQNTTQNAQTTTESYETTTPAARTTTEPLDTTVADAQTSTQRTQTSIKSYETMTPAAQTTTELLETLVAGALTTQNARNTTHSYETTIADAETTTELLETIVASTQTTTESEDTTVANPAKFITSNVCSGVRKFISYLPHPQGCDKYYICFDNFPFLQVCHKGWKFDPVSKKCVTSPLGGCNFIAQTTTESQETAVASAQTTKPSVKSTSSSICSGVRGFIGYIPHPHNCNKYYICFDHLSFLQECREGRVFDPVSRKCVISPSGGCRSTTKTEETIKRLANPLRAWP